MPHFVFNSDADGKISSILKDGRPYKNAVKLEQHYSISTIYFEMASQNLLHMKQAEDSHARRRFGIQAFLMSITGLEAFTNTYFYSRARELNDNLMLKLIDKRSGSLSDKISNLVAMTPAGKLRDHDRIIRKIKELSYLRHDIVHPRWEPSSLTIPGDTLIVIDGLVENRQSLFEDEQFCKEAMLWCLFSIARIGQSEGWKEVSGFLFHWTANYGMTIDALNTELGLPADQ